MAAIDPKLARTLLKSGVSPDDLLQAIGGGRGAGPVAGETRKRLLGDFISGLTAAGLTAGGIGLAGALSPTGTTKESGDMSSAGAAGSRFFTNPEIDLKLIPQTRADEFRTSLLNSLLSTFGFKDALPMPRSPQEILGEIEARTMRQGRDLTDREIEKIQATKEAEAMIQRIIQEATTERTGIEADALVRGAGIKAGADVQGERLRSTADYAKSVLGETIAGLMASGQITDRSPETQLATLM